MTSAESIVTILVAIAGSTGMWGTLQLLLNRNSRRAAAASAQAEVEKANVTKAQMLAEAQALAQKTALDSAHEAYESVRSQCDACRTELAQERRLRDEERGRTDARLAAAEREAHTAREETRQSNAVLRKLVRALSSEDMDAVHAAIAAARELI